MSEEQIDVLLAKTQKDAEIREHPQNATEHDAAVTMAQQAGLDASTADQLSHQAEQTLELNDDSLSQVAGGISWVEDMPSGISIA
jgi:predicted ribosomally synthesized peptide with nif11-like leader